MNPGFQQLHVSALIQLPRGAIHALRVSIVHRFYHCGNSLQNPFAVIVGADVAFIEVVVGQRFAGIDARDLFRSV
jgi:hypothetical protein